MEKEKISYLIDILMGISFLAVAATGILKLPPLTRYFTSVYSIITPFHMARIHDISGVVMALLVLVHLILHWNWIVAMTKNIFKRK
jgi:cytochrome b subunit of formate dehydrogenase